MRDFEPCPKNPGYFANTYGEIIGPRGWILAASKSSDGYRRVVANKKTKLAHRMIAEALIPNPLGFKNINHINGDKSDNRVVNLEWCTQRQNIAHAHLSGLCNHFTKIDEITAITVITMGNSGFGPSDIEKTGFISRQNANAILKNRSWKTLSHLKLNNSAN